MSYKLPADHMSMVFDNVRNRIYHQALEKAVTPDSVVMDLGAGIGLHGILAARLGAKRVYLVEPKTNLVIAKKIAEVNGVGDRVICIPRTIEDAEIPEPVDIIVSVFTGNFLLEEDLLPSLYFARDKYLKPGGVLLPHAAEMKLSAVSLPKFYGANIDVWQSTTERLDVSSVRMHAVNNVYRRRFETDPLTLMSRPVTLDTFDFMLESKADCRQEVSLQITTSGICHGLLGWFQASVGSAELSTGPEAEETHWSQIFFPLAKPLNVSQGDQLTATVSRPVYGDWRWIVRQGAVVQQQTTAFREPVDPRRLSLLSDAGRPVHSMQGEALLLLANLIDGKNTTGLLVDEMFEKFPKLFQSRESADKFVRDNIESFCQ